MQTSVEKAETVRVTMQYWKGDTRICELECRGRSLDIHVTRPEGTSWTFQAHSTHSADAIVIAGSGSTRAAALIELAAEWSTKAPVLGLAVFDWNAVAEALRAVNVIE